MKTISIFIRAKNEAETLEKTLLEINRQEVTPMEVIVLDNDSRDKTCEIARQCGAKVEKVLDSEFTYGRALNRSLEIAQGEIIVFLSAHSAPCDSKWLGELTQPIEERMVEVTFGRQVPIAGLNVFEEWFVLRGFPAKRSIFLEKIGLQMNSFSNGNAALSREILKKYPFCEDLAFAEDIEWAERIKQAKIEIKYCAKASVYHSHTFKSGELKRRMINAGQAMKKRRHGQAYANPITCFMIHAGTIIVDFFYCALKGYWSEIKKILPYRKEFFGGIREGLRN